MVTKEFIKEFTPHLTYVLKRKDSNLTKEDLQDLVQDVFEKVTLYQDYFDDSKGSLKSWLSLMCVHVYDRYARGLLQIDEIAKDYTKDDLLESHNDYYYNNNKEEVDTLINLLPNNQRDIVYFKLILGHTYDEIATKVNISSTAASTTFSRGLANLKKLINSDNPEQEIMYEPRILKPHGDKPYSGDWAWRYGETKAQRNGKQYIYTNEELVTFCTSRNLNYNIKERTQ